MRVWTGLLSGVLGMVAIQAPAPSHRPDAVVEGLERAYGMRDFYAYEELLAGDFLFEFGRLDVDQLSGPARVWSRAEDLQTAWNMFHAEPAFLPGGGMADLIQSIQIRLLPEDRWREVTGGPYAGAMLGRYRVQMDVRMQSGRRLPIGGLQEFYVGSEDTGPNPGSKLLCWRDLGPQTPSPGLPAVMGWGELKELFHGRPGRPGALDGR